VQESLTNVIRHAGRASATVTLRHEHGQLLVDIVNDGVTSHPPFSDGTSAGLTGMRERAAALGGALEAGSHPGGFRVHAELPTTAATGQEPGSTTAGPDAAGLTGEPDAQRVSQP
jgi:signal transduction histidine kinase